MIHRGFRLNLKWLLLVTVLALGAALVAACGGDDDDEAPTGAATTAPAGTSPADTGDPSGAQEFSINQEFWHSGFHLELTDGTLSADEDAITGDVTYLLTIVARFENLGPSQTFFDADLAVVGESNSYPVGLGHRLLDVPGGLSSDGELAFQVDEDFDPESAYLLVGSADENQARVPLGAHGGELVDLAPSEPAVSGQVSLELIDLTFTSAGLRADVPVNYTEVDEGKLALTLNFDATSRRSGNWNILAPDFALILPSGSAVGVDGSDLASLPGSEAGTDTTDLYVRFVVNDPVAGEYTLRFTPGSWFVGEDGVEEATLTFDLG